MGHAPVAALLVASGAEVGTRDASGLRPVDLARQNGHPEELVRLLV